MPWLGKAAVTLTETFTLHAFDILKPAGQSNTQIGFKTNQTNLVQYPENAAQGAA